MLYDKSVTIYNKSLNTDICPYQWLEALIAAIRKKVSRDKVENYRPISLTSVISKVMESIVRDAIVCHMVYLQMRNMCLYL